MLSEKQILFCHFLLDKLGFSKDEFREKFIRELEVSAKRFRILAALPDVFEDVIDEKGNQGKKLRGSDPYKSYEKKGNIHIPTDFNIIDFLNHELKIKNYHKVKIKSTNKLLISATDISNFTFCPVSFSIAKTFDVEKIEAAYIGERLHDEKRLSSLFKSQIHGKDGERTFTYEPEFYNAENKPFFDDILKSKLLFCGHEENNTKKYFRSQKGDYVGQPDYIFNNSLGGIFVVEEKFIFEEKTENNHKLSTSKKIYQNHLNQLISYIHGINDYPIEYGYLVYWKYDGFLQIVHSCQVQKVIKTDDTRTQIITIYQELKKFIEKKNHSFDFRWRNHKKCANCVTNVMCGHKTGKFDSVSFPYSLDYFKTYKADFPPELIKNKENQKQNDSK